MIAYINEIQRQLITVYGFPENPDKPGLPMGVKDGTYPMTIHGKVDYVVIKDDYISCGNFTKPQ